MGAAADPVLLAGLPAGQSAGDLLQTCLGMLQQANAATVTESAAVARPPLRVTVRSDQGGDTLSELEKRERSAVQADVSALELDASAVAKLSQWSQWAAAGTEALVEQLSDAVSTEPAGALKRLVLSSTEVSSVTVEAQPETVQLLSSVRCSPGCDHQQAQKSKPHGQQ